MEHKVSLYADDAIFFLINPSQSLPEWAGTLAVYVLMASYKINEEKSILMVSGSHSKWVNWFCVILLNVWEKYQSFLALVQSPLASFFLSLQVSNYCAMFWFFSVVEERGDTV